MATKMAMAKQTALALERIQATIAVMAQEAGITPPSGLATRYRDADLARMNLLSSLADWLEAYHETLLIAAPVSTETGIPQRYLDAEQLALAGASNTAIVEAFLSGSGSVAETLEETADE